METVLSLLCDGEHGVLKTGMHPEAVAQEFRMIADVRVEGRLLHVRYNERTMTVYVKHNNWPGFMFMWPDGGENQSQRIIHMKTGRIVCLY
jgi:hypothetical protein